MINASLTLSIQSQCKEECKVCYWALSNTKYTTNDLSSLKWIKLYIFFYYVGTHVSINNTINVCTYTYSNTYTSGRLTIILSYIICAYPISTPKNSCQRQVNYNKIKTNRVCITTLIIFWSPTINKCAKGEKLDRQ